MLLNWFWMDRSLYSLDLMYIFAFIICHDVLEFNFSYLNLCDGFGVGGVVSFIFLETFQV